MFKVSPYSYQTPVVSSDRRDQLFAQRRADRWSRMTIVDVDMNSEEPQPMEIENPRFSSTLHQKKQWESQQKIRRAAHRALHRKKCTEKAIEHAHPSSPIEPTRPSTLKERAHPTTPILTAKKPKNIPGSA